MQKVHLIGDIAKFGAYWETDCATTADIFKLIACQTPGFRKYLIEGKDSDIAYEIRKGKDILIDPNELYLSTVEDEDIIITEVPDGAKAGLKIVLGIILVVAGVFALGTGFAWAAPYLFAAGASLIVGGLVELLAPGPETEDADDPSYLFGGPVSNVSQGLAIPVLYGELIISGGTISAYYSNSPVKISGGDVEGFNAAGGSNFSPINYNGGEGGGPGINKQTSFTFGLAEAAIYPEDYKFTLDY